LEAVEATGVEAGDEVTASTSLLARNVVVACRTAGFPKRNEQRGSLVVVWALYRLPTKLPDILKVTKPKQDLNSSPFSKFVFIDFLVYKSLFTRGF